MAFLCGQDGPVTIPIPSSVELDTASAAGERKAIFLSELLIRTAATKERRGLGHWINIHRNVLRDQLGGSYPDRIAELISEGIIERNDHYLECSFAKSYRLTRAHRHGESRLVAVRRKPSLKAVRGCRENAIQHETLKGGGQHFAGHLSSFTLRSEVLNERLHPWAALNASQLISGNHRAKCCQYGRFHSLWTGASKLVRQHAVTRAGERVSIVDVSHCQPLILGVSAQRAAREHRTGSTHLTHMCHVFENPDSADHWIRLCERGELYAHIRDRLRGLSSTDATVQVEDDRGFVALVDLSSASLSTVKRAV